MEAQLLELTQTAQAQVQEGREAAAVGEDRMSARDIAKLQEVEEELKEIKGEFNLERQSFEQQLVAEAKRTHHAERERKAAREEVEQMHLAEQRAREVVQVREQRDKVRDSHTGPGSREANERGRESGRHTGTGS